MLDNVILWIFILATVIQLFFWLFFFPRLALHKPKTQNPKPKTQNPPPATVIICAHNESKNLQCNLYRFINQSYRSSEILVINHNSCDDSSDILSSLQSQFKHLRVIECEDPRPGKKVPLALGIEKAAHQVLLLTDADCLPASDRWMEGMMAGFDEKTNLVLGVSPYEEAPGFLNKFIRFESWYTAVQYLSFALAGLPYMGVGRNLAYRKRLYQQSNGFKKHERLASGDDDLFVNQVAEKGSTRISINPETFIYSKPKTTWKEYYRQKTRHYSTGKHYKLQHKALLFMLAMSHLLHYAGGIYLASQGSIFITLLGYAVRISVVMIIGSMLLKKLQHRSLLPWLPALDALLVLYYLVFFPSALMNTTAQRWN